MLRAIIAVYLGGAAQKQGNGDPYGVRVNNAVDDIGPYKNVVELMTIKNEAGAMMESKAFLKFRLVRLKAGSYRFILFRRLQDEFVVRENGWLGWIDTRI